MENGLFAVHGDAVGGGVAEVADTISASEALGPFSEMNRVVRATSSQSCNARKNWGVPGRATICVPFGLAAMLLSLVLTAVTIFAAWAM